VPVTRRRRASLRRRLADQLTAIPEPPPVTTASWPANQSALSLVMVDMSDPLS
jgi:hypothetical protein